MTEETVITLDEQEHRGERTAAIWSFRFLAAGDLPQGTNLAPGLFETDARVEIGELKTVLLDFQFALECFLAADRLGPADSRDIYSRALVSAGSVSYARAFGSGLRLVRLELSDLSADLPDFAADTHAVLLGLRDKQIAHSASEEDRAESGPLLAQLPDGRWSPRGVGTVVQNEARLTRQAIRNAAILTHLWLDHVKSRLQLLEGSAFDQYCENFSNDSEYEMPAVFMVADRAKSGQ